MSPEDLLIDRVAAALSKAVRRPLVVGLCGPQGSGKSTLAEALVRRFERAATLSLDDLYLTRAERQQLAREVHPLLATRGVPGTHDLEMGRKVLSAIDRGEAVPLPRFDKRRDDRANPDDWPIAPAALDLVVFEGWCVGATPQASEDLIQPVNVLERDEDEDGRWRRYVNTALHDYAPLFGRVDFLVLLQPPSFEVVLDWRIEQEHALRALGKPGPAVMTDVEVVRFIAHYERLTRHVLATMPHYADEILELDERRRLVRR